MKFIILKDNLKEVLRIAERAGSENSTLPILKHVVIKADTRLTIIGTNLEIGVTAVTNAKIIEAGDICVPLAPLLTIISGAQSERITLESKELTVTVSTDNYKAKLQGVSVDEFPIIPTITEQSSTIEIPTSLFKTALTQVLSAAATNDIKPELNSVLFLLSGGALKLVATDGFRLAEKTISHNAYAVQGGEDIRALIPLKTALEIMRIFPDGEQLALSFDQNQLLCKSRDISVISRLIDGSYPAYEAIIPVKTTTEISFDRDEFAAALKLVSSFSGRSSDVTLKLDGDNKEAELFASNQLLGENSYQVSLKKKKVEAVRSIIFNWRFLLDAVRAMSEPVVTIGITAENKPVVIRSADESLFYVVMPVQI